MRLLRKIKSYFVIKRSIEIRKSNFFIGYRDFLKKHDEFKEYYETSLKGINLEKSAYLCAERDGFSKSPEYYWFKTEKTIVELRNTLLDMLRDNTKLLIRYKYMISSEYRQK